MQRTSGKFAWKIILGVILLIALAIGATLYFISARQDSEPTGSQAEAVAVSNEFIDLVKQGNFEESYDYLQADYMTYATWQLWVDSVNQPDVRVGDFIAAVAADSESDDPQDYQVNYSTEADSILSLTMTKTDNDWKIATIQVVPV